MPLSPWPSWRSSSYLPNGLRKSGPSATGGGETGGTGGLPPSTGTTAAGRDGDRLPSSVNSNSETSEAGGRGISEGGVNGCASGCDGGSWGTVRPMASLDGCGGGVETSADGGSGNEEAR